MAKQVQLRTQNGGLTTFNFLTNAGLQLRPNTLSFAPQEGQQMKVVLPLMTVGDETAYLAADAALQAYQRFISLYRQDVLLTDTPWFYWNTAEEATKRYYVHEMRLIYPNSREASPLLRNGLAQVEVHLLVHYAGESETAVDLDTITLSARGNGKATLPSGYGSTLNRISKLAIKSTANAELDLIVSWKFWLGIRRAYLGFGNFSPEWDLPYAGFGTEVTDASGIGGKYLSFNLASSPSYSLRTRSYLTDITSSGLHWVGSYRLLLRQRLSAANMAVSVQARYGYRDGTVDIPGPYTPVQSGSSGGTNWNLVDLGPVTIPPGDYRGMVSQNPITDPALNTAVGRFKVELWAELTSGSGSLHLDALYLVPDTNLLIIEGGQLKGSPDVITVRTYEDDTVRAIANFTADPYALGDTRIDTSIDPSPKAWGLPPEGGMLVFIGQSTRPTDTPYHNHSTITQSHDLDFSVIERWLSHSQA